MYNERRVLTMDETVTYCFCEQVLTVFLMDFKHLWKGNFYSSTYHMLWPTWDKKNPELILEIPT